MPVEGADPSGVNDSTAALAAALSTRDVELQAGTFLISSRLSVQAGTRLRGVPGRTVIKTAPGVPFTAFLVSDPSGVTFQDLIIDMNKAETGNPMSMTNGIGIYFAGSGANARGLCAVRRCTIRNGWSCAVRGVGDIGTKSPDATPSAPIEVSDCDLTGCGYGVLLSNLAGPSILRNRISGHTSFGVSLGYCRDVRIEGNTVTDVGGVGLAAQHSRCGTISANVVRRAGGIGVAVGGGNAGVAANELFAVNGNVVEGCGVHGISVDPTIVGDPPAQPSRVTVSGNVIANNVFHGLYCQKVDGATLTGNEVFGSGGDGISFHGRNAVISGNRSSSNVGVGCRVTATAASVDPTRVVVKGNNCHGNAGGDYSMSPLYTLSTIDAT